MTVTDFIDVLKKASPDAVIAFPDMKGKTISIVPLDEEQMFEASFGDDKDQIDGKLYNFFLIDVNKVVLSNVTQISEDDIPSGPQRQADLS